MVLRRVLSTGWMDAWPDDHFVPLRVDESRISTRFFLDYAARMLSYPGANFAANGAAPTSTERSDFEVCRIW
jgi:hypothetical protein